MSCNQSFTSSTDAILHDSDPRKLRFVELAADGTETQIKDILPLVYLDRTGYVPPTMAELTGGAGNEVHLTLQSPTPDPAPTGDQLTAGTITITITTDSLSNPTYTFTKDLTDLQTDGIGVSDWTKNFGEAGLYEPGVTILRVVMTTSQFTAVGLYNPILSLGVDTTNPDPTLLGSKIANDGTYDSGPISILLEDAGVFEYRVLLSGITPIASVFIPIDAASIIAACSPAQLAAHDAGLGTGSPLQFGGGELTPYVGWTVLAAVVNAPYAYGPSTIATDGYMFATGANWYQPPNPLSNPLFAIINNLPTNPSVTAVPIGSWILGSGEPPIGVQLMVSLGTTIPAPKIMTEAYELRHRNLPAFHFRTIGPFPETEGKTYRVAMFVSQGPVKSFVSGVDDWTWTQIAIQYFDTLDTLSMPAITNVPNFKLDNANSALGLPNAYRGYNVMIPQGGNNPTEGTPLYTPWSLIGPWNYVRFMLLESGETDYTDWSLEIIANAREAI